MYLYIYIYIYFYLYISHNSKSDKQYVQRKEAKLTNYEWFDRFCNNKRRFIIKVIIQGTEIIISKFQEN